MTESLDEEWPDYWIMTCQCDNQKAENLKECVILFLTNAVAVLS